MTCCIQNLKLHNFTLFLCLAMDMLTTVSSTGKRHAFVVIGWEYATIWAVMGPSGDLRSNRWPCHRQFDGIRIANFSPKARVLIWLPGSGWIEERSRESTNPSSRP